MTFLNTGIDEILKSTLNLNKTKIMIYLENKIEKFTTKINKIFSKINMLNQHFTNLFHH